MEIFNNGWWIALAVVAGLVLVGLIWRNRVKNRAAAQYRADESTIINIYNDMGYNDLVVYKDLPNLKARIEWLKHHAPDFVAAAERHYKENELSGAMAIHLDFRLIKGITLYTTRERAISVYQTASSHISLREYEEQISVSNAEFERLETLEREAQAKYRAERDSKEKAEKEAAKSYWNSLSSDEQETFKQAKGQSDRQKAMTSPVSNGYSVETLYPLIMATEFSGISTNHDNSIDYCQSYDSSSDSSSPYTDSSSYSDSGSSYSDSSSSCDSGGGDGGGGGGGD